ncbi:DUF2238 domain-containing protein [Aestuariivirga sp.]|uniref:DUF2238 domain-containing protein n=1 Tax=Aestuariivirga sp. TaxID=2650926 RepID=UPI003919BF5E
MMLSSAVSPISARLAERQFALALLALYAAVWLWAAWNPSYRFDWVLENMLPTVMTIVLALSFRRLPLSDVSYLLLFVFLVLHQIGAHYTYSEVPFGWWFGSLFGAERNHFDRLVHFSFGFLLFYPMREIFIRFVTPSSFFAGLCALSLNTSGSAIFEIIEMLVAIVVNPEAGAAYLGHQGDEWDAQKDMALALLGSILAFGLTELAVRTGTLDSFLVPRQQDFRQAGYK